MPIHGDPFCAMLHGLCSEPDVVRGNRRPTLLELVGDPGIAIGGNLSDGDRFDRIVSKELAPFRP
jgi:hypothetical protein